MAAQSKALKSPSAATPLIRKAIDQLEEGSDWVPLGRIGQLLANLFSDFDPRTYGHAKLGDLVEKTGAFEMRRDEGRGVYIRAKAERPQTHAAEKPAV